MKERANGAKLVMVLNWELQMPIVAHCSDFMLGYGANGDQKP